MQLPTLREVASMAGRTIERFPLAIIAAYSMTILAIIANHRADSQEILMPYIFTLLFAFPFSIAVDLFMESHKAKAPGRFFARFLVVLASAGAFFYLFQGWQDWSDSKYLQVILLDVALWSLVLFAPFLTSDKVNGYWQFAVALFVRAVQAALLFGLFYWGLLALMAAIEYLFDIGMIFEYATDVWVVVTGIFVSLFFLSGIPGNFQALDKTTNYPKLLRVLVEFFLVPLVYLYLVVLYAYAIKTLIVWEWPKGDVSSWIFGFSAVGVFAYGLIYSAKEKFLGYVEFFKKWFFVLLMPILVLLFLTVGMEIKQMGVTEFRYFLVAFGSWLLILGIYFSLSHKKNLKFIPITLFLILLVSTFGPQSAFGLSEKSHLTRLEKVLEENNVLVDGKVSKVDASKVSEEDRVAISADVYYIVNHYGVESLQPWFNENLKALTKESDPWNSYYLDSTSQILTLMGFEGYYDPYYFPYETAENMNGETFVNLMIDQDETCWVEGVSGCGVETGGYKYFYNFGFGSGDPLNKVNFKMGDKKYAFQNTDPDKLVLEDVNGKIIVSIDIESFVNELLKEPNDGSNGYEKPKEKMTIKFGGGEIRLRSLSATLKDGVYSGWDYMDGELLMN